jgi:hypothetical protein
VVGAIATALDAASDLVRARCLAGLALAAP